MTRATPGLESTAAKVERAFKRHNVRLTLGGEPTYVPDNPTGAEWTVSAVGPTKLGYANRLARTLAHSALPGAAIFFSPGKTYPGEPNPRWALHLVANRDGSPLFSSPGRRTARIPPGKSSLPALKRFLCHQLAVPDRWLRGLDPLKPEDTVWILPLDFQKRRWTTGRWKFDDPGRIVRLLAADGPAGLRLPLSQLPDDAIKRALTLEFRDGTLRIFFPPLLQKPFLRLLRVIDRFLKLRRLAPPVLEGYVPADDSQVWTRLGLTADPGVLEVNLPPCHTWHEYRDWLVTLDTAARGVGLRSWKLDWFGRPVGTGGGNHILIGGPTISENPLFSRPAWVAAIIRYWQRHPCLSYLFTGSYVGTSSQAPRPDESSRDHPDLEMAYATLEALPPGDHRILINETLRHMHIDAGGNTHRTEISFDKFWSPGSPGGCLGLIEFRAVESLPKPEWMAAVALLWRALMAMLLTAPPPRPLASHNKKLHDAFFLPAFVWDDLKSVLADLDNAGFPLPDNVFREIWNWRLPEMAHIQNRAGMLTVRAALDGWPLLCEIPMEGGNTSRFVDTSMERLEIRADPEFAAKFSVEIGGAEIPLGPFPDGARGAGVRFRRSALYPCLHPGIPPHVPLHLVVRQRKGGKATAAFRLEPDAWTFTPCDPAKTPHLKPASLPKLPPPATSHDLRNAVP